MAKKGTYYDYLRQEFGDLIDQLELPELKKRFLKQRWLDQVVWSEKKAAESRYWHYRFRLTTITGGVILPALVGVNFNISNTNPILQHLLPYLPFALSQVVAVTAAIYEFCNFGERWRDYRQMAEDLKAEGWQYFQLSDTYGNQPSHEAAYSLFASRVEGIIKKDVQEYVTDLLQQFAAQKQQVEQYVELAQGTNDKFSQQPHAPIATPTNTGNSLNTTLERANSVTSTHSEADTTIAGINSAITNSATSDEAALTINSVQLSVPYIAYTDYAQSSSRSNTCSVAMCLTYLDVKRTNPDQQFEEELQDWLESKRLDQAEPSTLQKLIAAYDCKDIFTTTANLEQVKQWLAQNNPCLIQGHFTSSGHAVCIIGYHQTGLIVNDPWGKWTQDGYDRNDVSDFHKGEAVTYPYDIIQHICISNDQFWVHFIANSNFQPSIDIV